VQYSGGNLKWQEINFLLFVCISDLFFSVD
jgi:hypothetical protein